ncbi:hypothetical protein [Roseobacter sp. HKCCA0882]|uniref:hypothetical protein n=1 Tax=Roseobacter sp. HKCCA0882 TaxID=3120337 RepID=UPI0030ED5861
MKHLLTAALIATALASPVKAERYLCAADRGVGFVLDEGTRQWVPNVFDTDRKYLISITDGFGRAQVFGNDWSLICQSTTDLSDSEDIICGDLTSQINLSTETLRFTRSYNFGFIHGDDIQRYPSLSIGTCVELNDEDVTPSSSPETPSQERSLEAIVDERWEELFSEILTTPSISEPLAVDEIDELITNVRACWNTGALGAEAQRNQVTIRVELTIEGRAVPDSIELIDSTSGSATAIMELFESARRAILRCGANGFNLPPDKFDQWKTVEFVFNPNQMRLR